MVRGKAGPTPAPVKKERKKKDDATTTKDAASAKKGKVAGAAAAAGPKPTPTAVSEVTPAEKQAVFVRSIAEIVELNVKIDGLSGTRRTVRKKIISYGFEPFEIDFALALGKSDQATMVERRRREHTIALFMNHPIGTQPDMFDNSGAAAIVDRTPASDKAFADGKQAGMEGAACKPPYHTATEQSQKWVAGWHEGQALLATGIKKLETPPEPAKNEDGQTDLEDGLEVASQPPAEQQPALTH